MERRDAEALDRHITGNYGEDQFRGNETLDVIVENVVFHVSQSYELAMQAAGLNPDLIGDISDTVGDYVVNNFDRLSDLPEEPA